MYPKQTVCLSLCGIKITGLLNIKQNGTAQAKRLGKGGGVAGPLSGGLGVLLLFVLGTNESATFPTPAVNVSKSVTHS